VDHQPGERPLQRWTGYLGLVTSPGYTEHVNSASTRELLDPVIRPLDTSDLDEVTRLNNDAYPAVPRATEEEISDLVRLCDLAVVAEVDGDVVGFLLAVEPGKDYDSENYRFFESQNQPHFYIDRIVLGESARGRGLGTILYRRVFSEAEGRGFSRVTCEVNLKPENPISLAFHEAMGFRGVGVQDTKGGSVRVQLLEAPVGGGHG